MAENKQLIRGFTIIELLIVIVIIGILAALTAVVYSGIQAKAYDTSVLSDIDTMDSLQTSYGLKNGVSGKEYYSGNGPDGDLGFTASGNNVIDVVVNAGEYCIRGYNPGGTKTSIQNSYSKGSSKDACELIAASIVAGGAGGSPLIGWWKLNGNASDSSGNSNNGFINGATPVSGSNGQLNGAYGFDGLDDYISISDSSVFTLSDFTVSTWTKTTSTGSVRIVNKEGDSSSFGVLIVNSKAYFFVDGSWGSHYIRYIGPDLNNNTWRHIAAVRSGDLLLLYVDGALIGTRPSSTTAQLNSSVPLIIGRHNSTIQYFEGHIDDVRVYNKGLSSSEVLSLYEAGAK